MSPRRRTRGGHLPLHTWRAQTLGLSNPLPNFLSRKRLEIHARCAAILRLGSAQQIAGQSRQMLKCHQASEMYPKISEHRALEVHPFVLPVHRMNACLGKSRIQRSTRSLEHFEKDHKRRRRCHGVSDPANCGPLITNCIASSSFEMLTRQSATRSSA